MAVKIQSREAEREIKEARGVRTKGDDTHAEWVRDHPKRIREAEQKGYRFAGKEDVDTDHDGYEKDGIIRNGDLVLMIGSKAKKEADAKARIERAAKREKTAMAEFDRKGGLITDTEQNYRSRGGRQVATP